MQRKSLDMARLKVQVLVSDALASYGKPQLKRDCLGRTVNQGLHVGGNKIAPNQ